MPFRLHEDAERWFRELDGKRPTKTMFDLYYFCLMAALASGRASDPSDFRAREIIDEFIQDYQPAHRLLIGLLVAVEVRRGGVHLSEKAAVRSVFHRLVTAGSKTQLTERRYALHEPIRQRGF